MPQHYPEGQTAHPPIELAVAENTLFALPPINRTSQPLRPNDRQHHCILSDILAPAARHKHKVLISYESVLSNFVSP
jgi:hypothetical protein